MDRHTTATLKSRWFDWAAFEALEGFTCLSTLSSQIRQFSFLWWHLILTCVLWMSIDPSHQQLPSMCDMGNWNSRTVASIGWNYPTPTNCRIKKVPWSIFLQCWKDRHTPNSVWMRSDFPQPQHLQATRVRHPSESYFWLPERNVPSTPSFTGRSCKACGIFWC